MKTYVIRSLPIDILGGLKAETSLENKPTEIGNSKSALEHCKNMNFIELLRLGSTPSEFPRLDVNLERIEALAPDSSVFGDSSDWGDVLSVRYERCYPIPENQPRKTEGAAKEPVIVRDILGLECINKYWEICSDKHKSACADLIGKAAANPEGRPHGTVAVPYSNTNAYGRKYARGPSLQKIGRAGRNAALRKNGVDVDMENCHPSLMRIPLGKTHTSDGEDGGYVKRTYHMVILYTDNYRKWRNFCMGYYDVDVDTAVGHINKIYYGGGCHRGELPSLHALRVAVAKATEYLTPQRFYERLGLYYTARRRPISSHLSLILSFEEDALLTYICEAMDGLQICLMYDGAVFGRSNLDDVSKMHRACASLRLELGVGVCIKQRPGLEDAPDAISTQTNCSGLLRSGQAENVAPLEGIIGRSMCLYNSARYLQFPEFYDRPKSHGPFNVGQYNQNARGWVKTRKATTIILILRNVRRKIVVTLRKRVVT